MRSNKCVHFSIKNLNRADFVTIQMCLVIMFLNTQIKKKNDKKLSCCCAVFLMVAFRNHMIYLKKRAKI